MKSEIVKVRFDLINPGRAQEGQADVEPTETLEVDLAKLDAPDRQLLARRREQEKYNVFDVCKIQWDGTKEFRRPTREEGLADFYVMRFPVRVQALKPTL